MKAIVTAVFEIDVSEWFADEGLTKKQRLKRIEEELADYSVLMENADYKNFSYSEVTEIV